MNNKIKPALTGGIVLGILSVIPFVSLGNACCCAWAILGGALAAYLYTKSSPTPVNAGDGAILGALAGVIGGVVYFIIGIPISLLMGNAMVALIANLMRSANPEAAHLLDRQLAIAQHQSIAERLLSTIPGLLIGSVILIIFALIGGIIGVLLFEKRKGGASAPPPPPSSYGDAANPFQTRI
jgi:hypothetical protein